MNNLSDATLSEVANYKRMIDNGESITANWTNLEPFVAASTEIIHQLALEAEANATASAASYQNMLAQYLVFQNATVWFRANQNSMQGLLDNMVATLRYMRNSTWFAPIHWSSDDGDGFSFGDLGDILSYVGDTLEKVTESITNPIKDLFTGLTSGLSFLWNFLNILFYVAIIAGVAFICYKLYECCKRKDDTKKSNDNNGNYQRVSNDPEQFTRPGNEPSHARSYSRGRAIVVRE